MSDNNPIIERKIDRFQSIPKIKINSVVIPAGVKNDNNIEYSEWRDQKTTPNMDATMQAIRMINNITDHRPFLESGYWCRQEELSSSWYNLRVI